jgi:hypothetical protein
VRAIVRILVYLWVLPTTAVGLAFVPLAMVSGGRMRVMTGVLEIHGGLVGAFLRRLARGASAMTLGHVVIGQDGEALEWSRSHERIHVCQCERWGPLFLPAYGIASLMVWLRGGRAYWDNPFEREAYEKEAGRMKADR